MNKSLGELRPGEKGIITVIDKNAVLKKRLIEMGIREGTEVFMRRDAPLGDPMEFCALGYNLSLRRSEANYVQMKDVETIEEGNGHRWRNRKGQKE